MFNDNQKQKEIVIERFKQGERMSALSCLNDGVSPSSFTRIYKELKDTGRYQFDYTWSKTNPDGSKKKGAYKIRWLVAEDNKPFQMELAI